MKKIVFFLIEIIALTTAFCQEVFIYNENGTPYYFTEKPNVKYVEFSNNLSDDDFEAVRTALFQYADTIQNLEDRLFRLYVGTSSLALFEMAKNTYQEALLYCNNGLTTSDNVINETWNTNKLFLKTNENVNIENILSAYQVPYSDIEQLNPSIKEYLITLNNSSNSVYYADLLYNSGSVIYCVPDFSINIIESFVLTPEYNPEYPRQWGLNNIGQKDGIPGIDINADSAWHLSSGNGIVVATLNDGVDLNHSDLVNNLLAGFDTYGYYSNGRCNSSIAHKTIGTSIAGNIAAENNNDFIVGVAPNAKIMPVRIYSHFGQISNVARVVSGINYAYQNGADIIDVALFWAASALTIPSTIPVRNAIDNATTFGRDGKGCVVISGSGDECSATLFPANYGKVLSIGGIDRRGMRSGSNQCINHQAQTNPWGLNDKGSCFGTDLDVVAPGTSIFTLSPNNSAGEYDGTAISSSFVSGVAALMLSRNNNLTEQEVRDIIRITAKEINLPVYTYQTFATHPYGLFNNKMGYGLVNSYQAIKSVLNYDLYTRDDTNDNGFEPNPLRTFNSPDMWNRQTKDGGLTHQTAFFGDTNYVYVRVHNKGSIVSAQGDSLTIYAKKDFVNLSIPTTYFDYWPNGWEKIGGIEISGVPANGDKIFCVPVYYLPIYNKYNILSLIKSPNDALFTTTMQQSTTFDVQYNNNVSMNNVLVTKKLDCLGDAGLGALFNVSLATSTLTSSNLLFHFSNGTSNILNEAEVTMIFPEDLLTDWTPLSENLKQITANTYLVTGESVELSDIPETDITLRYNFLTRRDEPVEIYKNYITQYVGSGDDEEFIGGLTIQIEKPERAASDRFRANAGNDTAVLLNTTATLHATQINEDAIYRWYDKQRNFKYEGVNYSFIPSQTSEYILEVTAESDGYRDLDTVKVNVVPGCIRSITPNPVSDNWVTVSYEYATTVTSAQLLIYNTATTALVGNYDLSNMDNVSSLDIEVTNYPTGSYTVVLVCDNAICHSKILIRQ